MTKRKSPSRYRNRVVKADWEHAAKPYEQRVAESESQALKRRKRLRILAAATGHDPGDLVRKGWVTGDYDWPL